MSWISRRLVKLGVDDWFEATHDSHDPHDTPKDSLIAAGGKLVNKAYNHVGNGATTDNLFIVPGAVQLISLYGIVTAIGGGGVGVDDTMNNLKIEIFPGPTDITLASSDLTDNGTVGTLIVKDAEDSVKMAVLEADAPKYSEGPNNKIFQEGVIVPQTGTTTYIRASYTGDASTDITIDWHIRYVPKQSDAVIIAV